MANPLPDPNRDGFWPSCDDQQPGVSIRPLSHADLPALLAHLDHSDADTGPLARPVRRRPASGGPVVAVRVRASVGGPGASAQAEYRRRRAVERAAWSRGLPWRAAAVLVAGAAAGLLAAQLALHLTPLAMMLAAAGLGWQLQFRPSPETRAWRRRRRGATHRPPARPWSATAGRSCTTWPSPARRPTSTTWPSAPAA
jgi:hypothetical protein